MNLLRTDNTANVSKYWTNDIYTEVFSPQQAEKIVYYSNSNTSYDPNITHSAVVSSVSGYYESKGVHGHWYGITFNHVGIYEMYLNYYNNYGKKIADC